MKLIIVLLFFLMAFPENNFAASRFVPCISGTVYYDTNKNGIIDVGVDEVMPGVEIRLRELNYTFIASVITDANGNYSFCSIELYDDYNLQQINNFGVTSSIYCISPLGGVINSSGYTHPPINFLNTSMLGNISGHKFAVDEFGVTTGGVQGVTMNLYYNNQLVESTVTDQNGFYEFTKVSVWDVDQTLYTVSEVVPNNMEIFSPASGSITFQMDDHQLRVDNVDFRNKYVDCCNSFKPIPGGRYWVSAWVKEEHAAQVTSYLNSFVQVEFFGAGAGTVQFGTSGEIIDGWQRIVGDFTIPMGTTNIGLHLVNNNSTIAAFFDDVRVHPFNASMKSYVYDPVTLWLTAELDDNNYATFYEYDNEGQLIRIKKETERGIMTIQESRSSNPKKGL